MGWAARENAKRRAEEAARRSEQPEPAKVASTFHSSSGWIAKREPLQQRGLTPVEREEPRRHDANSRAQEPAPEPVRRGPATAPIRRGSPFFALMLGALALSVRPGDR
jgi:hypothetical protein